MRLALLGSALSADFVTEGRSLVLLGKPGRGKTHLAVAIAYRAIQNGFETLFVTAAELIDELSAAFRKGRLAEALARFTHPHVLVVDEVGYLTYGTDAANMLFHVVNDRHKRKRSMIFTTNKPLAAWGRVLHDEDLAQAIVDRVLERGRLLHLDGPSMRTKHLGLDDPTAPEAPSGEVVRISGIQRSELPEPTHFTPTSSSWLNLVERWFSLLSERQIKRATHRSTFELERAIRSYLDTHNKNPKPFIWTKTADEILASVARFCTRTDSGH